MMSLDLDRAFDALQEGTLNKQRQNMPRSPGRPKGSPNKVSSAVKDMVREALDGVGGVAYLMTQASANPTAFLSLVGKLLPTELKADVVGVVATGVVDVSNLTPDQKRTLASIKLPTDR